MARNSGGTHSLPAGNPVVSGTAVSSTVHNNTMSDISTEITDSLSRSGKGPMTAPLELANGSAATPALSFDSDTDTGLYRKGADSLGIAVAGAEVVDVTAAGIDVTGAVSGDSGTLSGNLALTGSNPTVTTGFADTLTPTNIPKAWACITKSGAGAIALTAGFNVASAAYSSGNVLVTFATAMADANYAIVLTTNKESAFLFAGGTKTTSAFNFSGSNFGGSAINLDTNAAAWLFYVLVFGAQ